MNQAIRAHIESKVYEAYQALVPPIEVMFDNVQETPPALPYVICLISYLDVTTPVICQGESMVEQINGNLQLSVYAPRGRGMGALELYAQAGIKAMATMYDATGDAKVKCGAANGPTALLSGDQPYAVATVSCSFVARYDDSSSSGGTTRLQTSDVLLTHPTL